MLIRNRSSPTCAAFDHHAMNVRARNPLFPGGRFTASRGAHSQCLLARNALQFGNSGTDEGQLGGRDYHAAEASCPFRSKHGFHFIYLYLE
jgi:hypothetical protein